MANRAGRNPIVGRRSRSPLLAVVALVAAAATASLAVGMGGLRHSPPAPARPAPTAAAPPRALITTVAPPPSSTATETVPRPPPPDAPVLVWQHALAHVTFRESSPVVADLGRPSVVVGALDGRLYAYDLAEGSVVPGWPVRTNAPINSSPAAADVVGAGTDQIFVGSGTADNGQCSGGGVWSFDASGNRRWARAGFDPNCTSAHEPFHSSPTIGDTVTDGTPKLVIGALGLNDWSLNAVGGGLVRGWPIYTDDTSFSTAALADVAGEAAPIAIIGGDASPGGPQVDADLGMPANWRGGLVRAVDGSGKVLWQYFTDDMVRSSPAVGDITGTGRPSVVFGTGDYWYHQPGGAHDSTKVFALSPSGQLQWSRDLGGVTMGSPALADVGGTGVADVVIGTAEGPDPGKVWVLDGAGRPLPHWAGHPSGGGEVIGGITTADLNGDGHQDLIVPTGLGVYAYDGRTGAPLFALDRNTLIVQNSPLVTQDAPGVVGITIAGTTPAGVGIVQHWAMPAGAATIGTLGWPMFHHDARHTGNLLPPALTVSLCASFPHTGFRVAARDGGVFGFCDAPYQGSAVGEARSPVVGIAPSAGGVGYWVAAADGSVYSFGHAPFFGSASGRPMRSPVVGIAATPDGRGYWLLAGDGGVFTFGDAPVFGAARPGAPVTGMAATPDGRGYWLVSADGGVFTFGDATFAGSRGATGSGAPIVGIMATPDGRGYWLIGADGGVFTFGTAPFFGSAVGIPSREPIIGMTASAAGS